MKTKTIFKTTAVTLALTMAFTAAPVISSGAKAKAPALNKKSISLLVGEAKKLTVKKNGNKIKKITWSSKNKESKRCRRRKDQGNSKGGYKVRNQQALLQGKG